MIRFNAQCGEDKWILENLKPEIGVFCEVGAFDGVLSSNTLAFEDTGWNGILIEADRELAEECRNKREARTLPFACGKSGERPFYINRQDRGLSGLNRPGEPCFLNVRTLEDILLSIGVWYVDLLSIDTEGTELEVWHTRGNFRPEIVIMEYQTCNLPPQDKLICKVMEADGYKEVHRTQYNLIFTR